MVNFGHMANLTQYSEHKRAEALAVVAACGGKVAEEARRVGVPRRTLQRWKDEADNRDLQAAARQGVANAKAAKVAKRIAEAEVAKFALSDSCERLARRSLMATKLPDKIEEAKLGGLAWTAAIMVDKMRLLREQPAPPTEVQQRMADAVAQAAQAIVDLAAQAGRTITLEEAANQVRAVQLRHSQLTLTDVESS